MSSMLTKWKQSLRKVTSMIILECILKDHSSLYQLCHLKGILTFLEETWWSRLQMEEHLSNGTSTRSQELSSQCTERIGLGILRDQANPTTCMLGTPIQNGGKCGSLMDKTLSSTSTTTRCLMSKEEEIKKETTFKCGIETDQRLSNGNSSMLTKLRSQRTKDLIKILVLIETDHSTLSLNSQWKE